MIYTFVYYENQLFTSCRKLQQNYYSTRCLSSYPLHLIFQHNTNHIGKVAGVARRQRAAVRYRHAANQRIELTFASYGWSIQFSSVKVSMGAKWRVLRVTRVRP